MNTSTLVQKCKNLKHIKQIHCQLITTAVSNSDSRLFTLSAAQSDIQYTTHLFSLLKNPPATFFFNTLLKSLSKFSKSPLYQSLSLYKHLRNVDIYPDEYTFPLLIRACSLDDCSRQGRLIHGQVLKFGFNALIFVNNALIHFYSVFGCVVDARLLFDDGCVLDVVSWNSMISGYVRIGDMITSTSLFDEMPERNVVSWTALISGYVQCGLCKEALTVFSRMQVEKIRPNNVTLVSVLAACAHLGTLEQGKWVHGYLKSNDVNLSVFLGTSLIDMYAKCGELEMALEVFYQMGVRNLLTWTTMIKGLAMHGRGTEALRLFSDMEKAGIVPDDVALIGVLCACTHAGLVDQGRQIFNSFTQKYGIRRKIEHYGCMIDLLSRNGLLDEARDLIQKMPMAPDVLVWGALLAGCRLQKNIELAVYAGNNLIQLEPESGGVYVLLANIYAASGRLEEARKVRDLMDKKGVRKIVGCSSIEIRGIVHQFIVGDMSHPEIIKILAKWEEIERKIKTEGYISSKGDVLLDINEEDKDEALARHSEKLAIAFGLISSEDGLAIRIVKNLRVCNDCHLVTKLISKVYDRELLLEIVHDSIFLKMEYAAVKITGEITVF